MNYVCGTCNNPLERLNDDCTICKGREEAKKQKIKEEYEVRSKK